MTPKRIFPVIFATVAVAAVPALASEPSSGTVSNASPTVSWTGAAPGYGVYPLHLLTTSGGSEPTCNAPYCDTFALKVADQADLAISAANTGSGPNLGSDSIEIDVVKPDGTVLFNQSGPDSSTLTVKIKNAAPGDYTIRIISNDDMAAGGEYEANATLGTKPAAAPAPVGGGTPAPAPAPGATPAPAASQPAVTLSLKTTKLSARKATRSAKLALGSTGPVTGLKAALKLKKKVVATGKLAKLDKAGTVVLKLKRKLKPGAYTVGLSAKDSQGRAVGLIAKLKVTK